ncbi:MAG TPA: hypothetical protein VFD43_08670 [Planctomycetota bacterium]|nr:hypothetical protein [Planctomycetota bacterium]
MTGLVLVRSLYDHGARPVYRYEVLLAADGDAVWDGTVCERRQGRFTGRFDPASFEPLVQSVLDAPLVRRIAAGGTLGMYGAHNDTAIIRVIQGGGRTVRVGHPFVFRDSNPETALALQVDSIEAFAETIDWRPFH